MSRKPNVSRREFVQGLAAVMGGAGGSLLLTGDALAEQAGQPKFLIVLGASGGASIVDGPLAVRASECATPSTLNTFADELVTGWDGSPFRAVDLSGSSIGAIPAGFEVNPSSLLGNLREDLLVATWNRTSVNHAIGQRRAITGNEAWKGRTLQELVAWQYGIDAPIPNVHLLAGTGYSELGTDASIPTYARGQLVANPAIWPLSLDGSKGSAHAIEPEVLKAIRRNRNEMFEPATRFEQVFQDAPRLIEWHDLRGTPQERIEGYDLVQKLMFLSHSDDFPLADFGLGSSPAAAQVQEVFTKLALDPLEAQAALAFLLLKYRVSVSVTLGPSFDFVFDDTIPYSSDDGDGLPRNSVRNPPLAFDVSHQGHRSGQAVMWSRLYGVVDGLKRLLQTEDMGDGSSMWDHTLIYIATDFGREKKRPEGASDWGTGHHINNGVAMFSPLVPGDTLRGGVDPDTLLTHGFDRQTGESDTGRTMEEAEIFSGILGALGVDLSGSGLPDMPSMRRS